MFAFGCVSHNAVTAEKTRIITYADTITVSGRTTAVIISDISLNGAVRLSSYLKQRSITNIDTIYLVKNLKEEVISKLAQSLGCTEIINLSEHDDLQKIKLRAADCSVIIDDNSYITIYDKRGDEYVFSAAQGNLNGFDIWGTLDNKTIFISEGTTDYHGSDVTIYLETSRGFTAVKE